MNYDEVARTIERQHDKAYARCLRGNPSPASYKTFDLVEAIAAALRRAANEAAWDGYRTKRDIIGAAKMTEKYGPKEARDE